MLNKTDKRIAKWYRMGVTLEKIAKRIGRPNDIQRVKEGLKREGIKL